MGVYIKKIFQRMSNLFSRLFCSNSIFLVIHFRCRNRFNGHCYFFRERAFGFTENWWFGWWRGWKVWETEYDEKSPFSILTEFKERKICNVFDASFLLWKMHLFVTQFPTTPFSKTILFFYPWKFILLFPCKVLILHFAKVYHTNFTNFLNRKTFRRETSSN